MLLLLQENVPLSKEQQDGMLQARRLFDKGFADVAAKRQATQESLQAMLLAQTSSSSDVDSLQLQQHQAWQQSVEYLEEENEYFVKFFSDVFEVR